MGIRNDDGIEEETKTKKKRSEIENVRSYLEIIYIYVRAYVLHA